MFVSGIEGKGKLKMGCSTDKVSVIFIDCYNTRSSTKYKHKKKIKCFMYHMSGEIEDY